MYELEGQISSLIKKYESTHPGRLVSNIIIQRKQNTLIGVDILWGDPE